MTARCWASCPLVGCPECRYGGGEIPAAATESAPISGVASGMIRGLAHTRETPAKARTDRGRGPTFKESNKMDRTRKASPAAGA